MEIYQEITDTVLRSQFEIVATELKQLARAIVSLEKNKQELKQRIEKLRGY